MSAREWYWPDVFCGASLSIVEHPRAFDAGTMNAALHADEIAFAQSQFKIASRREQWLFGRFVLKNLLRRRYNLDPAALKILTHAGRPEVSGVGFSASKVFVSLAHKGDYFAAAVSTERRVGVDLEVPRDDPLVLDAIRRACRTDEIKRCVGHAVLSECDALFLTWCAKETCVKSGIARNVFAAPETFLAASPHTQIAGFDVYDVRLAQYVTKAFRGPQFHLAVTVA